MPIRICEQCGVRALGRSAKRYCSPECYGDAQRTPLDVRFHRHVNRQGSNGCWLWTAATDRDGYGVISDDHPRQVYGRQLRANRVAYELAHGPISNDLMVLHRCDNPPCVNPSHLFLGTAADNNKDMAAKGRATIGDKHWKARLSESDIQEIRRLAIGHVSNGRWSTGMTYRSIAARFGVTPTHVADIVSKKRWSHVA